MLKPGGITLFSTTRLRKTVLILIRLFFVSMSNCEVFHRLRVVSRLDSGTRPPMLVCCDPHGSRYYQINGTCICGENNREKDGAPKPIVLTANENQRYV